MQGQSHGEAEVPGRSKATGLVCRSRADRGVCHLGEIQWRDIRGAWSAENKTGVTGVMGYGSCGARQHLTALEATDWRTLSTFTRSSTHTYTPGQCLLSARFIAHLEIGMFSSREKSYSFYIL